MSTVHLQKRIESDTLHLPELRQFLGKTVEITIAESSPEAAGDRWEALRAAAGQDLIDSDVVAEYRDFDRRSQRPTP